MTKSGKYFIHGSGGPMSTYAVHHGNNTSGSEQIRPLTAEEARQWAKEKLSADEYSKEFGEPDEAAGDSGEKNRTAFILSPSVLSLLRKKKAQIKHDHVGDG